MEDLSYLCVNRVGICYADGEYVVSVTGGGYPPVTKTCTSRAEAMAFLSEAITANMDLHEKAG